MNPPSRSPSQPSGLESGRTCVGNPAFLLRGTQQADVKTIDTPQKVRYFLAGFREQCCTILAVLHYNSLLACKVTKKACKSETILEDSLQDLT